MEWRNDGILGFKWILAILICYRNPGPLGQDALLLSSMRILPLIRQCILPEPIIPAFQHSNWGESTKCNVSYPWLVIDRK